MQQAARAVRSVHSDERAFVRHDLTAFALRSARTVKTWLELESRFRNLEEPLRSLRLDFQWGDAGEHWNLTGLPRSQAYREVQLVSSVGGRLLEYALDRSEEPGATLLAEQDPLHRWFLALKELSGSFEYSLPAYGLDDEGNRVETIHMGSMNAYVPNSANLCLWLEANYPVRDSRTIWQRAYDDYGRELIIGVTLIIVSTILSVAFS